MAQVPSMQALAQGCDVVMEASVVANGKIER
jgi:hypothetical protein